MRLTGNGLIFKYRLGLVMYILSYRLSLMMPIRLVFLNDNFESTLLLSRIIVIRRLLFVFLWKDWSTELLALWLAWGGLILILFCFWSLLLIVIFGMESNTNVINRDGVITNLYPLLVILDSTLSFFCPFVLHLPHYVVFLITARLWVVHLLLLLKLCMVIRLVILVSLWLELMHIV